MGLTNLHYTRNIPISFKYIHYAINQEKKKIIKSHHCFFGDLKNVVKNYFPEDGGMALKMFDIYVQNINRMAYKNITFVDLATFIERKYVHIYYIMYVQ